MLKLIQILGKIYLLHLSLIMCLLTTMLNYLPALSMINICVSFPISVLVDFQIFAKIHSLEILQDDEFTGG